MCPFIWRRLGGTPNPSEVQFIAFADSSTLLESHHCQHFFLTNLYETATQVTHFVVSLGPGTSARTKKKKMNFNFMRRVCTCRKILLGKAGEWIILCCSSPDLQSLDLYKHVFSSFLYESTLYQQQRTAGYNSSKTQNHELCLGPPRKVNASFLEGLKMLGLLFAS